MFREIHLEKKGPGQSQEDVYSFSQLPHVDMMENPIL